MSGATGAPAVASTDDGGKPVGTALDRMLTEARVVVVIGPGGVGKTTITAALGCRAAVVHQRRVLVVTVDPARRLADALGLGGLPSEPVLVPAGDGDGRLWALTVDMSRSWDSLVEAVAEPDDAEALLANPLYRALTTQFVQSHDYIALDHLCDLADDERFDLVLIDTPPAGHAIDVLDAPDRMTAFFGSRFLRWLTAPYRSRLAQATARPFLAVAERLLGGQFLARIAEFFWLFSQLQPGFVRRARKVKRRLDDAATDYLVVTTSDPASVAKTLQLLDELAVRRRSPSVVVHNRAMPTPPTDRSSAGESEAGTSVADVDDPSLRAAVASLVGRDDYLLEALAAGAGAVGGTGRVGPEVATVPWREGDLGSVTALASLIEGSPPDGRPGC